MDSIEASPYPLAFKVDTGMGFPLQPPEHEQRISVRTATRALKGMQKEAIVSYGTAGTAWRTVCDEGPWLNGTDLAPFPLGFFTAGLAASYMSEFITHARANNITIESLEVMVDNRYGMEGSLLKGTMVGSALPVEATFKVKADATPKELQALAWQAVASSPADAFLRQAKSSLFSLNHNGTQIDVEGVEASPSAQAEDPTALFAKATPESTEPSAEPIITKLEGLTHLGGEKLGTVKGTGDIGLSDEQKRQVHVRGVGSLRADGMKQIDVACFVPVGSVFRFLSDDSALIGGHQRAPSGLAWLSAGLSFCFMTQLGRYAAVAKQKIHSYQIVQDTTFSQPAACAPVDAAVESAPVDTHVFIGSEEEESGSQTLLRMGEQTCYLHAACRTTIKSRIRCLAT
jgi:organic hydroperoxide reductase OsmC/OhrA